MRVLTRMLTLLGVGVVLVALAAAFVAWQLPSLQGTITIGNGDVSLKGFDDPDGDNAGLAIALAGVAVFGIVVAAVIAVVVGLFAATLGLTVALLAMAGSLVLVGSPLLLVGWLVWLAVRRPGTRPADTAAIAAS